MSKQKKQNQLTFVSLFSGAGGFSIGFKAAGFRCLCSSDKDEDSEKTHLKNWPDVPFIRKSVTSLLPKEILRATNGEKPDVIIGGPPCQGFSMMGDKHGSDPRNMLFSSYVNLVRELQPQCFVFENVKGLKILHKGDFLLNLSKNFAKCGYDIYFKILNAADFGVPQNRERVILIGTRANKQFCYPRPSALKIGKIKPHRTVGEAIGDLVGFGEEVPNHIPLKHGITVVKRYKLIPEGGKLPPPEKLPKEIRRSNFGSTYLRLSNSSLSMTLVPGNNAFPIHPTLDRSLTPREAARIQSFPDGHIFCGTRRKQCILVGNAVPPLLAANIAKSVKRHLVSAKVSKVKNDLLMSADEARNTQSPIIKLNSRNGKSNKKDLNFVDLFCGAGGITLGLTKSGFNPVLSADFNKEVKETHENNFSGLNYVHGDLSDKSIKEKVLGSLKGKEITLLTGGPPCQGFSIFGKRRFINTKDYKPITDPRNKLVFTFWNYVKELRPEWVIMENVAGFPSLDNGYFLKTLLKIVKKLGYVNYDFRILNAADYGVPQKRKRFLLIANRTGHIIPWPKPKYFQKPKDWQLPYRVVGDVITDLSTKKSHKIFKNHEPMSHSEMIIQRYSYVEEGKKMDVSRLPKKLQYAKFTGQKIKNFSHVYRRLHRDEASITLVPGHNAFPIHPWLNRLLTVREAARIQTFPDELEFFGSSKEQCIQVGNAFPCMLAERLGESIMKARNNNWKEDNISKLANYSILDKWYFKEQQEQQSFNFSP
jgi:DNA (cytosine-5)-methyltransferase 1